MIKLFIFDMGGVLARNFEILPDAAALLGMSPGTLWNHIADDIPALMEGTLSGEELWNRLGRRTGTPVVSNLLADLFHPSIDQATGELITTLKKSGRVVCGTNTMAEHYNIHSERGDYGVFDTVYASHLMGIAKPKTEFFTEILRREGVSPEETVFTDDLSENIEAARSLGIHAFLYRDARTLSREIQPLLS